MSEFVDASLFIGMHNPNKRTRVACKNYFVERLESEVTMSLENIGKCDNLVWQFPREVQDMYYPFMDNLHSVAKIRRVGYSAEDLQRALQDPRLENLDLQDRLSVAMAINKDGVLYTVRGRLIERADVLPIKSPADGIEKEFPKELEELYQKSLRLRI